MIFKPFLLSAIILGLFNAPSLATVAPAKKDNAAIAAVPLNYHTAFSNRSSCQ